MGCIYFYDLPVYRLSREAYDKELDREVDITLYPASDPSAAARREKSKPDPRTVTLFQEHLHRKYGCWEFNEIIGHIRLHFLGGQVRGEYFAVSRKNVVRTRTKTVEYQTWKLAPEVDIERPYGKAEILAAIRTYIEDCRREVPRRFIDASRFELLAPHVDWPTVLRHRFA
jgi:hypothetical protein